MCLSITQVWNVLLKACSKPHIEHSLLIMLGQFTCCHAWKTHEQSNGFNRDIQKSNLMSLASFTSSYLSMLLVVWMLNSCLKTCLKSFCNIMNSLIGRH
jgi:hypothetical protein